MNIQTFSIVAGSEACNAHCPFCISKMTLQHGVQLKEPQVNWRNFKIACRLAQQCGVTTAMLTGKGEPTLFPAQITAYLRAMCEFRFPIVELQTNGIQLIKRAEAYSKHLHDWYELGMTTIAVSIAHYSAEANRTVYLPNEKEYIDLPELIGMLHDHGLSVRLACIMASGFIDGRDRLQEFLDFARRHRVEQVTVRPVNQPASPRNDEASRWTSEHCLRPEQLQDVVAFVQSHGTLLMTLAHGAQVFDIEGQNVCLTDSLTIDAGTDNLRQLIFFPDGHLRYDWQHAGAILL